MYGAMMTNFFTLRALAAELHAILPGYRLTEIYSQKKNELILTLHNPVGNEQVLLISIDPVFHYLYKMDRSIRAKKNSVDLFSSIIGKEIENVVMSPNDRIINISLSNATHLRLHIYGTAASNIYLIDERRNVLESFKRNDELQGTILPESNRHFDDSVLRDEVLFEQSYLRQPDQPVPVTLKRLFPMLGSLYAEEVCSLAGIEPAGAAGTLSHSLFQRLHSELVRFIESIEHPRPHLYEDEKGDFILSVVPLAIFSGRHGKQFSSVLDAVAFVASITHHRRELEDNRNAYLVSLRREQEHVHRARTAAETEAGQKQRAEEYERCGKLILANIHLLPGGITNAEVPDVYGDGTNIRIKLNPRISPALNAERYFQLGKNTRVKLSEAAKRVHGLRRRETILDTLIDKIQNVSSMDELKDVIRIYRKELKAMNLIRGNKDENSPPFRVFKVPGDLEVWVGKNSANNDLLTMKYAKPYDLWFHARGASGSHTILKVKKNEIVPKEAIRQAATIAAYYSKMRNANTVPVAYCERKYVRKSRGLAPGAVVLDREELIFVQPGIP
jgi:predicted ribosome quality control (RQC) complex YloA/Tae2 family protein